MNTCTLCLDDYPADLIVCGTCYQCREALACHAARVLDAPDADSAAELAAHYDDTRGEPWEYAHGDYTAVVEIELHAHEMSCESRGEL